MKINLVAAVLATIAFGTSGLAGCQQESDDEGRWIELPGGRMVYAQADVEYNDKRLIYRIDDQRFFTMMTHAGDCSGLGGAVRYQDLKRGIDSKVGHTSFNPFDLFSMDPGRYLALPFPSGDLQDNGGLYVSSDYGRSWKSMQFVSPGIGMVVKDEVLVFLGGSLDGPSGAPEIISADVWGFARITSPEQQLEDLTPSADYYHKFDNAWTLRAGALQRDTPDVKIDVKDYINASPPSRWRHLRCDPIPAKPAKP